MTTEKDSAHIREFRPLLERELEELQALRHHGAHERGPVEVDQQALGRLSRMDALQQQEIAHAADRARQQRIARIRAALERMDKGEYGYCLACGEEIPDARLHADPTAPLCVPCATAQAADHKAR
jgi:DnaK suppressor protein